MPRSVISSILTRSARCASDGVDRRAKRTREIDGARDAILFARRAYDRAADDDPVGDLRDGGRLFRARDPEPDADGQRRHRAKPLERRRKVGRQTVANTGHAEPTDEVHEAAAVRRDLAHAFLRRCRSNQSNEREWAAAQPRFSLRVGTNW